ncbi:MAG: hypothetical protein JXQ87_05140 [Bacteroidia bacterium]
MLRYSILFSILVFAIFGYSCKEQSRDSKPWLAFYLGGQSNMDGYGLISELPDSLNQVFDDVYIFHGNPVGDDEKNGGLGIWTQLRPGHGAGFAANAKSNRYANRFGPELSFAARIKQLYPNHKIALIKYSRGGSSLDSLAKVHGQWHPEYSRINQYDHFLTTVSNAFAVKDIDGDGKYDKLNMSAIIWMQGESDADKIEIAALEYGENLNSMMQLQRAAFHNKTLAIVIGKISDAHKSEGRQVWTYLDLVQNAQESFVANDKNSIIVRSTANYNYSDMWHYDSKGFIDLGIQFANHYYILNQKNQ